MAIVTTSNASSVKVQFDHGVNINGDRVVKTKTLSSVKPSAGNEDIMAVVEALQSLQNHNLYGVIRIDSTSISR